MPTDERVEFGVTRTKCSCYGCVTNCRFIPGYLIPSDLGRLIPPGADPEEWARAHLRASPGAQFIRCYDDGSEEMMRVGTLVPAHNPDMSCHWLHDGRCEVHADAPFACAMFGCHLTVESSGPLSSQGINTIMDDNSAGGLYSRLWAMLNAEGLRSPSPDVKRVAMFRYMNGHQQRRQHVFPQLPQWPFG